MDELIMTGEGLLDESQFNTSKLKLWQIHGARVLESGYDSEIANEFEKIISRSAVIRMGSSDQQMFYDTYRPKIQKGLDFLKSLQTMSIAKKLSIEPMQEPSRGGLTQNFFLTQSQIQEVHNEIDFSSYDPEVQSNVEVLLEELKKKEGQDKSKIASTVKWLADRSIDVLIALIARHSS